MENVNKVIGRNEGPSDSRRINFSHSVANLKLALSSPVTEPRDLSGIIKEFEMSYELSWKFFKKFLLTQGHSTLGAKDVYSQAFRLGYLESETPWVEMISDRSQAALFYDEDQAREIVARIRTDYFPALEALDLKLE